VEALAVTGSTWPPRRWLAVTIALLLAVVAFAGAWQANSRLEINADPDDYDIAAWETRHFANKWLFLFGQLFRDEPSVEEQDRLVLRFLQLTREIEVLEREVNDAAQREQPVDTVKALALAQRQDERDAIENQVEATIEARLSAVIDAEGLDRSLLFLPAIAWPPVDFEFTQPPHTLAVSYRDRIELKSASLLSEDLNLRDLTRVEAETEAAEDVSALAFPAAGVAAYPTIVTYRDDYRSLLEVVAHEWLHNYLFFYPLGFNYYESNDLRTMNETVADLVGRELADSVLARWPLAEPQREQPAPPESDAPTVDFYEELRHLRGEVDTLLAAGRIEEAEALMEQRRRELADQGFYLRKINQAYFAFTNLYAGEAGNPAATNPIGPKIDELRRRSASLSDFVATMRGLTSADGLDQALAALD
jgi:hypothetical protein